MKTYKLTLLALALTAVSGSAVRAQAAVAQTASIESEPFYNALVVTELKKQSIVNPMQQLITGADTLDVTAEQVTAIAERNTAYQAAAAKEWAAFNTYLKAQGKSFNVA